MLGPFGGPGAYRVEDTRGGRGKISLSSLTAGTTSISPFSFLPSSDTCQSPKCASASGEWEQKQRTPPLHTTSSLFSVGAKISLELGCNREKTSEGVLTLFPSSWRSDLKTKSFRVLAGTRPWAKCFMAWSAV